MLRRLFSHSLVYGVFTQIPGLAAFIMLPVITPHLTANDFAVYGIVNAYLMALTALKDLGLGVVFNNTFYQHPHRWKYLWRVLYGVLSLWSICYVALLLIVLKIALPTQESGNFWIIAGLLTISILFFDNANLLGSYYFRFKEKPVLIGVGTTIATVFSISALYTSIVVFNLGYLGWFIANFVTGLCLFCYYSYTLFLKLRLLPIFSWRKKLVTTSLRISLPMIPHNYSAYLLSSSDRVILDRFKVPLPQIALYNVAYMFGNYFDALGNSVGMAVGPFYSKLFTSKNEKSVDDARHLTFLLMILSVGGTFVVALWLREIFSVFIRNDELKSAYAIGIIIIMGYAYRPMYWNAGIKLSIQGSTSLLWRISFTAGVLNVLLNLIFVPMYGIYAAAINTFISLIYLGFAGYFFAAFRRGSDLKYHLAKWITAIVLLTTVAYLLRDANILAKVIVTLLTVTAVGAYFKFNYDRIAAIEL